MSKMKIEEITNFLLDYFAKVDKAGVDGADSVNVAYFENSEHDGCGNTLYITFYKGDDRVAGYTYGLKHF